MVSLVGPGGVGKTRLAIRAAADLERGFRHGAWLVERADVRDPALVGDAVMAAVGLRDQAAAQPQTLLRSHLRDKELLLVQSLAMGSVAECMVGERASAARMLNQAQVVAANVDDVSVTLAVLQARAINAFSDGE